MRHEKACSFNLSKNVGAYSPTKRCNMDMDCSLQNSPSNVFVCTLERSAKKRRLTDPRPSVQRQVSNSLYTSPSSPPPVSLSLRYAIYPNNSHAADCKLKVRGDKREKRAMSNVLLPDAPS